MPATSSTDVKHRPEFYKDEIIAERKVGNDVFSVLYLLSFSPWYVVWKSEEEKN